MFDYARVQVVSSNGLMMLTHEKDPSNNLLPFFDLSFFASSNTAFDRTSGRESHRSQRFFLNCIVRWVAKFCGSPDAGQRGVRAGFGAHAGKERRALSPTDEDSHAAHFSGSRRVLSAEVENV